MSEQVTGLRAHAQALWAVSAQLLLLLLLLSEGGRLLLNHHLLLNGRHGLRESLLLLRLNLNLHVRGSSELLLLLLVDQLLLLLQELLVLH
jgi:hypothetical protein